MNNITAIEIQAALSRPIDKIPNSNADDRLHYAMHCLRSIPNKNNALKKLSNGFFLCKINSLYLQRDMNLLAQD